jgi:hypothetical protein
LFGLWLLSRPQLLGVADALADLAGPPTARAPEHRTAAALTMGVLFFLPIVLLFLVRRFRLRSWWPVIGGWLVVLPVLAYLAADEPSRRTIKLEEMAPAFPGAEHSYAVLMRYSTKTPSPEAAALQKRDLKLIGLPIGPDKGEEFVKFLHERRADIEADWAALEPERRWLDELNAFDRFGDLGEADVAANIIQFPVWRYLSQRGAAKAGLLALDGKGDEAMTTLLPILEAARKLEPSGRTLVRLMVARVVQSMMIHSAAFTLQRTTVSPHLRARLAAALKLGVGGEIGARRIVAIDYAGVAGWLANSTLGSGFKWDGKGGLRMAFFDICGPFVYNRERTLNLYGDLIMELQEIAARRESGKIDLRTAEFWVNEGRPTFKNFCGRMISIMTSTPLGKVVENYWKIEDRRTALIAQLEAS